MNEQTEITLVEKLKEYKEKLEYQVGFMQFTLRSQLAEGIHPSNICISKIEAYDDALNCLYRYFPELKGKR